MLWVFQTSLLEGAQGQCIELLCQHNQTLRKPLKLVATVAVVVEASLVTLTITGNQVCTFGSGRALPFRGAFKTWIYIWITSSNSCSCRLLSLTSFIILSTFSFARLSRFTIGTSAPGCQPKDRSQRIFPTTTEGSCKKVRVGMLRQFSQSEEERENFRTENGQFWRNVRPGKQSYNLIVILLVMIFPEQNS